MKVKLQSINQLFSFPELTPTICAHPEQLLQDVPLHNLRLHLKKLRTLCSLLSFHDPQTFPPHTLFKPFRSFFRASGRIRDLEVQQMLLMQMERITNTKHPQFRQFLQNAFAEAKKNLLRKDFQFTHWSTHAPERIIPEESLAESREKLMANLCVAAMAPEKHPLNVEGLHWFRKQLKKLIYLAQLPLGNTPLPDALKKRICRLEDQLGNWHDLYLLQYDIEQFETKQKTPPKLLMLRKKVQSEAINALERAITNKKEPGPK